MSRRTLVRLALALAVVALGGHAPLATSGTLPTVVSAEAIHVAIEGFGAGTTGGAGHGTCVVDSLLDDGPGTLRDCLSAGQRIVTFAVAGTIQLSSQLSVRGSSITIDGFSAPSPGITLRGWGVNIWDVHDVIVRGLRIRDAGLKRGKTSHDCIGVNGPGAYNIVIDHVSIYNCGDGGIDISSGPKNITIQWSIVSTGKLALWGSTSSSPRNDTDRISMHHTMLICGPDAISEGVGCDREPLVRAGGYPVSVDLRHNIFEGWIRDNGTKIEPAAQVNVVGNAYLPRPDSTFSHRQHSIAVKHGTRVFTADNVELGAPPRPDLNVNRNAQSPLPAPPITGRELGCVVRFAGMHPRDGIDEQLLAFVSRVPDTCTNAPEAPGLLPATPAGHRD
jgi:pectate lyase